MNFSVVKGKNGSSFGNLGKSYAGAASGGGGDADKEWKLTLDPWLIVKGGHTKDLDGQTLHQYPHHKKEGVYDGIYVTHPPERHEELVEQKINWGKKESTPASSTLASATSTKK